MAMMDVGHMGAFLSVRRTGPKKKPKIPKTLLFFCHGGTIYD
jgi:hypothetical protein